MAHANIENLAANNNYPTKAKGKRKKQPFKLRARKRGFTPQLFDNSYLLTDYYRQLPEHMSATTARNNNGMSYVW